jgi:nucleoside diphosphate kinase
MVLHTLYPDAAFQRKIPELYVRLEEFGVDVEALKRVGLSEDALDVLYCAVKIVDSYRPRRSRGRNWTVFCTIR